MIAEKTIMPTLLEGPVGIEETNKGFALLTKTIYSKNTLVGPSGNARPRFRPNTSECGLP